MRVLPQFNVFSEEGLEALAKYVSTLVPDRITVTVMYEEFGIINPDDYTSDFYSYDPNSESPYVLASLRNENRIKGALVHMDCSPPWSFDTTKYPVIFFSMLFILRSVVFHVQKTAPTLMGGAAKSRSKKAVDNQAFFSSSFLTTWTPL